MNNRVKYVYFFLLLMVFAFSFSGCSDLSGPSDEDVIKAVNETGMFKGGYGELTLQPPIMILEKGSRNKDGSWPAKVKVVFTYYVNKEQVSAPTEKTLSLNLYKANDNAGNKIWKLK